MANTTDIYLLGSGGWESKVKETPGLVSRETALPGLQTAAFLLCPHVAFPLGMGGAKEVSGSSSFSYTDTSPIGIGSHSNAFMFS